MNHQPSANSDAPRAAARGVAPTASAPSHAEAAPATPAMPTMRTASASTVTTSATSATAATLEGEKNGDKDKLPMSRSPGASAEAEAAEIETKEPAVLISQPLALGNPDPEAQREPDIYDRFSPSRKHYIVAIVSYSAFIGPVASSSFLPSVTVMAKDLNTTPTVINYTVAIFIIAVGVAPIFWSPLSGFYGRRPVYLISMPLMTVASIGVAESRNLGALIATRILQGIGSSCVLSVGAGTVGDIYRPTERANAMSWFYSGVLLGPALSPVLAGVFTEYTAMTWRATQYFLVAASALAVILVAAFLPETSHPPLPHAEAKQATGKRFVMYWFNPAQSLLLLRYLNITMMTIASSVIMFNVYCVNVPLGTVFQERYNISNVAIAGCVYISIGVGTLIGSRIAGPSADRVVRKWIEKRGYRRPEDRLRASFLGAAIIQPLSGLVFGWLLQANKGGIWPPLIMLVFNGLGMQLCLTPINTYLVDAAQRRSAEAIAVNNFWRYLFGAAASAFVLPMMKKIGFGWTMTVAAAIQYIGVGTIFLTLWYGEGWREAATRKYDPPKTDEQEIVDGGRAPDSEAALEDAATAETGIAADEEKALEREKEKERPSWQRRVSGGGTRSRRTSSGSHSEDEHGEPTHLPAVVPLGRRRSRRALSSTQPGRSGKGLQRYPSRASVKTLPTAGEMLQRSVSLGGSSVHGGG